jgi:methionyl aminopeptidase
MFPNKIFPLGEIQNYVASNVYRTTDEEKRQVDKLFEEDYQDIRCAAECHRQVSVI